MSEHWHEQTYDLKFQLGDLVLLRKKFPILAHACTLTEVLSTTAPILPAALPPGCTGVLIRSCPGYARLHDINVSAPYVAYTMASYDHCYIDLSGSFDDYLSEFSAKSRGTLTRKVKKFAAQCGGRMSFQCYSKPDELGAFYDLARQVSALTYQERLLDVGLPTAPAFVNGMLESAERGQVRAYLLFDGVKPVAYLYCPMTGDTLVYAFLGFDPSYAEWSVGTILFWLSLQSIFSEKRFSYFDLTEGFNPQKVFFSTHRVPCHNRLFLRDGTATRLLLKTHRQFDRASSNLGTALDRLGLKMTLKRLLRGM